MLRRHSMALDDFIERAAIEDYAIEPKGRILKWYDQERFSIGIRNDIRERWQDLEETTLRFAEVGNSILILKEDALWGDNE